MTGRRGADLVMKQSLRTRLVFISAGMLILSIVICWIMNLFLLPGYYESSKIKQMNNVYSQVEELFEENDWNNKIGRAHV